MKNTQPFTRTMLEEVLEGSSQVITGSIRPKLPFFEKAVQFKVIKNNLGKVFVFLLEPHNEKSLTNAAEEVINLTLKLLISEEILVLDEKQLKKDPSKIDRKVRVFMEDSQGRIDEVNFSLGMTKGGFAPAGVKPPPAELNLMATDLRWRSTSPDLFKVMKVFDLKN